MRNNSIVKGNAGASIASIDQFYSTVKPINSTVKNDRNVSIVQHNWLRREVLLYNLMVFHFGFSMWTIIFLLEK